MGLAPFRTTIVPDLPRIAGNTAPVHFRLLSFWCTHAPGPLSDTRRAECESLRGQVSGIIGETGRTFDERWEQLVEVNGTNTPRQSSIVQLAIALGHPEIAASILLGILDSGAEHSDIHTCLARLDVYPHRVVKALRSHDPNEQGWARPMANEIERLLELVAPKSTSQLPRDEPPALRIVVSSEPLPRRSDLA